LSPNNEYQREAEPGGIRFRELRLLGEHLGFRKRGGKGSHVVYEKDGVEEILTFQDRNGMAKPYQVKQLLAVPEDLRRYLELEAKRKGISLNQLILRRIA
jgi:predicted HicB family RNase H-like nuclease